MKDEMMDVRKKDHIRICLEEDVEVGSTGFENIKLNQRALPEVDLKKVETTTTFLGKTLNAPILIEAMTGGTKQAKEINSDLAEAAGKLGIGIEVGSQRAAIEDPASADTFSIVAEKAPDTLRIANLGAVQLNNGFGLKECEEAVEMIGAHALALHLNPLQEAIQPEGDTNFAGLRGKIKGIARKLSVPVIVKEVGSGLSREDVKALISIGVGAVDIGGYGGTSWIMVEGYRGEHRTSEVFKEMGIPTAKALLDIKDMKIPKIASGGIRSGLDGAKSIVLGANLFGMASPLLKAQSKGGSKGVEAYLKETIKELKIAMFATGASDISTLGKVGYELNHSTFRSP